MAITKIEWTDRTWNPITGCDPCSEGCQNCYAAKMAKRLRGRFGYPEDEPFRVTFHAERLAEPGRWKKPQKVFVCSMSDLFHPLVESSWLDQVLDHTAFYYPQHVYQILTKRPEFALRRMEDKKFSGRLERFNIWLGVTVENQKTADHRIPLLKEIPARTRFLSVEPMLEQLYLTPHLKGIDWVICGGETGQNARLFNPDWAMSLLDQCNKAGVPFFFKSFGKAIPQPKHLILEMQKNFPEIL